MENKVKVPEEPTNKPRISSVKNDIVGAVNYSIGTGKHAQDSVVWLTIKWSLSLGLLLSIALFIFMWPETPDGIHPPLQLTFPMDELKSIWAIFIPIVTLALGYMFGKAK